MGVALCLLVALWITDRLASHPAPSSLAPLLGVKQRYRAVIATDPVPGLSGMKAEALLEGVNEKIILTLLSPQGLRTGDRIEFEARLKRPATSRNPGGFDYRRHLERQGIWATAFVPDDSWRLVSRADRSGLARLRDSLRRPLASAADDQTRGFLAALLLGDRGGLTPKLWESFQKTGTAHLIAISGQHVGMVAGCFALIFLWLLKRSTRLMLLFSVRRLALFLALIPSLLYILIAGAPPSAVRAGVLLVAAAIAYGLRRDLEIYSALALAAIFVSLLDPAAPFGASFQLSFLAVLSLALLVPRTARFFLRDDPTTPRWRRWLVLALLSTVAATAGTAPLAAYRFHIVSISGLLTNLWAIPSVGLLLATGLLSLLTSFLLPTVGGWGLSLTAWAGGLFLRLIDLSARFSWTLEAYPTEGELFLLYLLLGLVALLLHRRLRLRTALVLIGLTLAGFLPWDRLSPRLEITFIDVGQGDAALIRTPAGEEILIDGGGFLIPGKPHPFDVGREVVLPYLKRKGVKKIDLMILSHPHPDHYGGLQAIVDALPVKEFWWNGQSFPDTTFDALMNRLQGAKLREIHAPLSRGFGAVRLDLLYPEKITPALGINDNCLVVKLTYGNSSFLFAGDIEEYAEQQLASAPGDLHATVLKIPHHGSRTSSSVPFIDAVAPRFAVASLADGNMFHFPHEGVLEKYERRGIKVFRTDQNGAVTFTTNGQSLIVKPFVNR